jgi:hypothetical protein
MEASYVGKPCPRCAYVRAATDTAPDWQCPKCGVAYVKVLQPQAATGAVAPVGRASIDEHATGPAEGSRGLAMFAHLSILLGFIIPLVNIIAPIVIWNMKS